MKILNEEGKCDEICLPRQEISFVSDVFSVEVHESSLLGKPVLHEDLNI